MKYKIKVEVMQDGNSRYYPMVKKHWWSLWLYILYHYGSFYELKRKGKMSAHNNIDEAKYVIKQHYNKYLEQSLDHTYEMPYKEEE